MLRHLLVTLSCAAGIGACGASPRPCPEPEPTRASSVIAPEGDVAGRMAETLNRAGHQCAASQADAGVFVCDKDQAVRATVVVIFAPPMAHFASHYRRKAGTTCDQAVPILNQLNLAVDGVKVVCVDDRITFVTSFLVPDNGISEGAVAEHTQRFQGQIQLLLREGALLPMLE